MLLRSPCKLDGNKGMRMKLWTVLFGLILTQAAWAQTQEQGPSPAEPQAATSREKVQIKVAAKGSGRILKKAEVKIGGDLFLTDPNGKVELLIPEGEGSIQVNRQGYSSVFVGFGELRGKGSYTVYLPPGEPDDSEVVITGSKRQEVSRKSISVRETERIAPNGDPAQITQLLPGVRSEPNSTEVVIRGSGPNDSRYFVDDIRVPSIFHAIGDLSVVPAPQLESVDFNSGGFSARYGDASGGIIVLRSKEQLPESPHSEFVVNVPFYAGLFHERPLNENSAMAVSFRRSTLEAILPTALKAAAKEGFEATVVPFFYDAYGRYHWKDDTSSWRVTAIQSLDGLTLAVPADAAEDVSGKFRVEFRDGFSVLAVEHERNLGDGWRVRTTPQISQSRTKGSFGDNDLFLNTRTLAIPTELSKRLGPGRSFTVGVEPINVQVRAEVDSVLQVEDDPYFDPEDAPKFRVSRDFHLDNYAAWSTYDLGLGPVTLSPGLRVFRAGLNTESSYDPRLQALFAVNSDVTLKGAVGQYSIAPEPVESSGEIGNPSIGYERAMHYVLGIETKWSDRWAVEFQTFYKRTLNLIVSGGDRNYRDSGERRTHGFEAFVRRNLTEKFFGWLSYTYSVSKERRSEDSPWFTSQYDQTHILNLAGSYKINPFWDLGTRFKYNTGNPFTPVAGAFYNASLDKYQPIYNLDRPNTDREPDFHSLDLFATYDSLFNEWKMKYQFGVQYIALGKRVNSVSYNYDYSKKEELSSLPPIPYIQISGSF